MKTSALPILLFILIGVLRAQPAAVRLEELTLPAKSPVATMDCLFEDSKGFFWIGAYTGLYRFDGYELQHFRHNPNDPGTISDNKIKKVLENPDGSFWVGTQVGLNFFDTSHRRFKHYSDTVQHGIGKVEINDLVRDDKGTLWVATTDGVYRFDTARDRFIRVFPGQPTQKSVIRAVVPVADGVFIATENQLLFLPAGKASTARSLFNASGRILRLYADRSAGFNTDLIWMLTAQGLFYVERGKQEVGELALLRNTRIEDMTRQGNGWLVCTDKGLFILGSLTRDLKGPLPVVIDGQHQPADGFLLCLRASNGISWFASNQNKLYKSDELKERFRHAPIDLDASMKNADELCELFEYQPGRLLIPRDEGAYLFDVHSGDLQPFSLAPAYNREGWEMGVTCFLGEPDSMLWIGTLGGVFLLNRKTNRFEDLERQFGALKQLRGMAMRQIFRDRQGRLWLATWRNGLFKIDPEQSTIRQYNVSPEHKAAYMHASRSMLQARDGTLWFGTRGGLLKYLEEKDSFLVYRNIPDDPTSMSENTAFCIYEDAKGNIWTGSYGGGLNCLDVKTGKFRHFTTDDGLLNNNVFSLLPDSKGRLWLFTFNGITLFDPARLTFQNFTREQGLLNTAFDAFLYGKSPYSNTLFFGGTKGVDYFDPDSVSVNQRAPKVYFTGFRLFNEPVPIGTAPEADRFFLPQDIGGTQQIILRYDQNVISFDFAALDFSSPGTVQYAYQLVGFDTAWQYVGDNRSVTFTNLDPGPYTLKVKASNGDGVWDPSESNARSLQIIVTPPWWHTWWFRVAVLLAAGALITAFYNYRIRQIREREAIKTSLNQRIAQVKMEALRSQMNPHFVFNCLSSLKLFVEKNETEKASDHISKFATLLRRVLDDARTDTDTVTLERELDTSRRYVELEMIRFKDKFDFRMDVSPDVEPDQVEIPPLVLQPYIENAILHGLQHKVDRKGLLLIQVLPVGNNVQIVIEDNGVGRDAARAIKARNPVAQQSHGLNVTAERLEYFTQKYHTNASVKTEDLIKGDGSPAGTRVMLTFQTD